MTQPAQPANPPVDYAVAVWLGMPDDEVARGLAEGWIRRPPGAGEGSTALVATMSSGEAPDAATVRRWLTALDPARGEEGAYALWQQAGADDAARCAVLGRFVASAVGLPADAPEVRIEASLAMLGGRSRILDLDGRSADELEALASDHAGVRRALATHSRWAVTGDRRLDALADPEGRFDRFDRDSGQQRLSDAWLGDRARHASWRWAGADVARTLAGDGWRFIDRAAGPSADVTLAPGEGGASHQVIFGREGGDVVSGGSTTDRIYGGQGDDVLRGRAGDDRLEGQGGADVLLGGAGGDDLAGGAGDDELDGGAGHDRLDGGGGADELAGGRGRDLLRGGAGEDTYVFESGDGDDAIVDDDGRIVIDGVDAVGTMARDGDGWISADGHWAFELEGQGREQVLTLRSRDGEDRLAIQGWQQGRFGITLQPVDNDDDDGDVDGNAPPHDDDPRPDGNEATPAPVAAHGVDASTLAAAWDAWNIPVPPGAGGAPGPGPGVTVADLAHALADGTGVDEEEAGMHDRWSSDSLRRWWTGDEAMVPERPEFRLQSPR